ncbi:hypothetical protein ACFL5Q_04765 [Planctomycetota bacterium]
MQLKSTILPVLGRRTLKRIVDKLEIDVDRRSGEAMRAALSRSRKVAAEDLLDHMLKDEIKALCGKCELSGDGRREELLERLKSLQDSVTQGLDDGSRIKSRKGGWVVVDRHGLFLADPSSATWVMSPRGKETPAARFRTPAAAYLAWMQSQEVAKGRTPQPPAERS